MLVPATTSATPTPQRQEDQRPISSRLGARITAHVAHTQRDSLNQLVFDRVEHTPIAVIPGVNDLPFLVPDDVGIFLTNAGRSASKQVEFTASPSIEWRNGFPWSSLDVYRDYAGTGDERRSPDYSSPDLQVTKGFRLAGIPLRAGILVTNFIFHDNPRDVIATVDSPRFGEFLNKVPSRVYFGFAATF